jgi:FXSXX-COOH protein
LIADLRSVPLGRLAEQAVDADATVASVVRRILAGAESPSRVQVMKFNSAI